MMKKFALILVCLAIAAVACGQEVLKRDLELRKTAPVLNMNGSGAVLQFYNGDVSLTQSTNTLTLSGGDLALGANNLTMTGSVGTTAARITKGWFTNLEITNSPTINGVSIASIYAPLASPTFTGTVTGTFSGNVTGNVTGNLTGTASLVTGFTRNSGTITLSGGHGITLTTTGTTGVTLPTSGALVANPMTTAGDLIVGGASGVPSRLAAGITGTEEYSTENYEATGTGDIVLNIGATMTDPVITNAPRSTGTVVAGTGITSAMLSRFIYFNTASAIDITADPQIANGTSGQLITIVGSSDTNTLTLDDSAGLRLTGQMVLGIGDNITLFYEGTIGDWIEISRSNN